MNDELRDRRVAHALADMAAGQATGLGDLFDLLGDAVYRLSQTLTHDEEAAEDAAVETFRRLWSESPAIWRTEQRPAGYSTSHVMWPVACAKRRSTGTAIPTQLSPPEE